MLERLYDFMIEGQKVEDLMIDGRTMTDPETGEVIQIWDILEDGAKADLSEYQNRMEWAARRLDEYMETSMTDKQFGIASGLSAEYEREASLYGFVMGFKAAMRLMSGKWPEVKS